MTIDDIYEEANKQPMVRSQFRLDKGGRKMIEVINNNLQLTVNWEMYKMMMTECGQRHLIKKYKVNDRVWDQKNLKELSMYMLINGPQKEKYWYLFVGIENLYGYNYEGQTADMTEKIKAWVQNKFRPQINGNADLYEEKFRVAVRNVLSWKPGSQPIKTTLQQFAINIAKTSTTGSAYDPGGPREYIDIHDIHYETINNKFAKSAVLSVENKINRILAMKKQKANVSVKVEPYPKTRLIVASDFNMNLKMRFVDTWLKQWMHGNTQSTLWQNRKQTLEMWLKFADVGENWNIPIDQSAFDHKVTKRMVQIMNEEIIQLITDRAVGNDETKEHLIRTMQTIIYAMDNCTVVYDHDGTKTFDYRSGVLSGWQWTAFYDTLANIAERDVAKNVLLEKGIKITELLFSAQGDDQCNVYKSLSDGVLVWLELSKHGFEIHPSKNFFSNSHNEYLRKYATKDCVNGYPARLINKIMWVYPGSTEKLTTRAKMNEIYSRWKQMSQRCMKPLKVFAKYLFKDAIGAKLNKSYIAEMLGSKKTNGGIQSNIVPTNNIKIDTTPGEWKYHVSIHGEGYRQFKEIFGQNQSREMDEWILAAMHVPDVINHKEMKTEEETIVTIDSTKPLEFVIIADSNPLIKPIYSKGWDNTTIYTTNDAVMHQAFPDIDKITRNMNAPKSWVYDYIIGQVKISYPEMETISPSAVALAAGKYDNSVYQAMVKKRRTDDKWKRLNDHFVNVLPAILKRDSKLPSYFVL